MLDFQTFMLMAVSFLTCVCGGFIVGVNMATPIKAKLAEQILREMQSHLREAQAKQEKENVGGFRLTGQPDTGRASAPGTERKSGTIIKWRT